MTKKTFAVTVLGVAAIGATVYFSVNRVQKFRTTAALKQKTHQTSEKIKQLAEKEVPVEVAKPKHAARLESHPVVVAAIAANQATKVCESVEIAGAGVTEGEELQVDAALWNQFMGEYHAAKSDLIQWLDANREQLGSEQVAKLEEEIRETRVMRPQNQVEPDLSWRGVLAWTRPLVEPTQTGAAQLKPALIHVTPGFVELFQKDKARARFEITRSVAQSLESAWAPGHQGAVVGDFLACMGFTPEQLKGGAGVVSETTWALSSAIATQLSKPGCTLPAFTGSEASACLQKFKAPNRAVASAPQETHGGDL